MNNLAKSKAERVSLGPICELEWPTELPPLTILVGPNGSGKSLLLKGLRDRNVQHPGLAAPFLYLSHEQLVPPELKRAGRPQHGESLRTTAERLFEHFKRQKSGWQKRLKTLKWSPEEQAKFHLGWPTDSPMRGHEPPPAFFEREDLTVDDFAGWLSEKNGSKSLDDLFLARVSTLKFEREATALKLLSLVEGGESDIEMLREHAEPTSERNPWDELNELLEESGLKHSISSPLEGPVQLLDETSQVVPYGSLSSGERTLFWLASWLVRRPKDGGRLRTLLLDEPDASLHPEFTDTLLRLIQSKLLSKPDLKCILTTHSPTTAALAPTNALFELTRMGPRATMCSTSRDAAVEKLTVGIPSLALTFEKRRVVLVESDRDAKRYSLLYELLRPHLGVELSLSFVGVGRSTAKGDDGSGCARVCDFVSKCRSAGSASIFGLIDWDTTNDGSNLPGVHVLAEGTRYAIENVLLDPLLVGALLIQEDPGSASSLGLSGDTTYMRLRNIQAGEKQTLAEAVARAVFPDASETQEVQYQGGFTLRIPQHYLRRRGHDLEEDLRSAFPKLRRFNNEGTLLLEIINRIVRDLPEFLPAEIQSAFQAIAYDRTAIKINEIDGPESRSSPSAE